MAVQELVAAFEQSLKMPTASEISEFVSPTGAHGYFLMMFLTSHSRGHLTGLKLPVELDAPNVFCIKISPSKS